MKNRVISVLLVLVFVFAVIPIESSAAESSIIETGKCGTNVYWELDNTGLLHIFGTGDMTDYLYLSAPWYDLREDIKSVIIDDGVTCVGNSAFDFCSKLTTAILPNTITRIGESSFYMTGITYIDIPEGVTTIEISAFNSSKLKSVTIPKSLRYIGHSAFSTTVDFSSVYYNGSPSDWSKIEIDKGNSKLLSATRVYAEEDIELFDNFQKIYFYDNRFTDVPANAWYKDSVISAYEYGLVKGTSETTFTPSENISLVESIVLACRIHNIYFGGTESFIQGEPWYQVYIDYALKNSIVIESQFSDYKALATRAQFAVILKNALPEDALSPINSVTYNDIPDVSDSDSYAPSVLSLYNAGVIQGSDKYGTFNPDTNITRSEVAAIVTRMAVPSLRKEYTLEKPEVPVQKISFNGADYNVEIGKTIKLNPTFTPEDATDKNLIWASSDSSIAIVDNGVITGIHQGDATITATSNNGVSTTCIIHVSTPSTPSQSARDYLKELTTTKGTKNTKNGQYLYIYDYDSSYTFALQYDPATDTLLTGIMTSGTSAGGVVYQFTVDLPVSGANTASTSGVYEDGSTTIVGEGYVSPSTHRYSTQVTLTSYYGSSFLRSTYVTLHTSSIGLALLNAETKLLIPNGYSLADLGFSSMK